MVTCALLLLLALYGTALLFACRHLPLRDRLWAHAPFAVVAAVAAVWAVL
jgi:hypothetical protein